MAQNQRKREREQISVRLDKRIIAYYTGLAADYEAQWIRERKAGLPPTRNWFIEQRLGLDAGIKEAVEWKEEG
jgi:hypothetical protein